MLRVMVALFLVGFAPAAKGDSALGGTTRATELLTRDLAGLPGKEGAMFLVEYPPGGADLVHRHNASVFLYVLEGTVVMQVRGGKELTLVKGQTFFEGPADIHVVGRNASKTHVAKFIVFFVKDKGAPLAVTAR